ncbi:radical SAM protein [Pseudomonas arsenicoxydans]|uniref:Radical SAM protein n=1 Tax=Pseudomonas arsenicoxydans TaxID=702115 RepID=A0A502HLN9_9PSED|nr:radical SAM protein [Pseudomonas arsenicoxydans]TPG74613.1 radical SAM protein [Pseudomonas arsenicoxydans]
MRSQVRIIDSTQLQNANPNLVDPVGYRKSGLSLNHIIGCPLDCSYCVRHLYGNFDQRTPQALMSDEDAFQRFITHRYFQPHITPIQLFNRATDPMLPEVKTHTHNLLRMLDEAGLTNNVLVITRWRISQDDCERFNTLRNLKLTVLVTYSGIDDPKIEPIKSSIAANSLKMLFRHARQYKVVLYWRPIVPGLNDSPEHITRAAALANHAHATVFSGLFYRKEIAEFYQSQGIPEPYKMTARRKLLPLEDEQRLLRLYGEQNQVTPIFHKTSCGVAFAHHQADYNGHFGITELCETCPTSQFAICKAAWKKPDQQVLNRMCHELGAVGDPQVNDRAIVVRGLDEQRRYYLQHSLGYQVHDADKPHHYARHGRAEATRNL